MNQERLVFVYGHLVGSIVSVLVNPLLWEIDRIARG